MKALKVVKPFSPQVYLYNVREGYFDVEVFKNLKALLKAYGLRNLQQMLKGDAKVVSAAAYDWGCYWDIRFRRHYVAKTEFGDIVTLDMLQDLVVPVMYDSFRYGRRHKAGWHYYRNPQVHRSLKDSEFIAEEGEVGPKAAFRASYRNTHADMEAIPGARYDKCWKTHFKCRKAWQKHM